MYMQEKEQEEEQAISSINDIYNRPSSVDMTLLSASHGSHRLGAILYETYIQKVCMMHENWDLHLRRGKSSEGNTSRKDSPMLHPL